MDVFLAAGATRFGDESADHVGTFIEEFDENHDTFVGETVGVAELLDLGLGEGVFFRALGA